ncbi:WG repeat-containing protein [Paenibacillus hamazuiensis]|uniref:WG repeat-containing protein n=1 Tax=Paenibacillus hamazuiensis TaxID=2936508 RepID=UPI00200BDD0E|nr:WG repeat-containing protein [Paenibacillus hamazuiensis]
MKRKMIYFLLAALFALQWTSVAAAAPKVDLLQNGSLTIQYKTELGDEKKWERSVTIVVKDGQPMVPVTAIQAFYNTDYEVVLITTYDKEKVSVLETRTGTYYEMKADSKKVSVLNKDKQKLREATLSTDVSYHLEGNLYPYLPLDFFNVMGYNATFDAAGKGKIAIDFIHKTTPGSGSGTPDATPAPDANPAPAPSADTPSAETAVKEKATLFPVKMDSKYGYIDATGKIAIEPQFDGANDFSEGLAAVAVEDSWGYIDTSGKMAIQPQYTTASEFSEGRAKVSQVDRNGNTIVGFINKDGSTAVKLQYDFALKYQEDFAPVFTGKTFGFVDRNGYISILGKYEDGGVFSQGLARVKSKDKFGYINKKNELVIPYQFDNALDFSEDLAAVSVNGKWGFINKKEEQAIPLQYDAAGSFSEGLAAVKINGKYGYINKSAQTAISPQFDFAGDFQRGFARVSVGEKWGFIDNKGKIVVEPAYEFAYDVTGDVFPVRLNGKKAYVDRSGHKIKVVDANGKEYNKVLVAGKVIEVNGTVLDLDVPPVLVNGSTLVPLRAILESLGLDLSWDDATKTITASKEETRLTLQVDNRQASVNGASVNLEVPPQIIDGATMVPVRFISESIGARVQYLPYTVIEGSDHLDSPELQGSYKDMLDAYKKAADQLNAARHENPPFVLNGLINDNVKDAFVIFGSSDSSYASGGHPGQHSDYSNIAIENPEEDGKNGGKYLGIHYYKGQATGKGLLGQDVPIYLFGGPPKEIIAAESKFSATADSFKTAKAELINDIKQKYESQLSASPDAAVYLEYAVVMADLAQFLNDDDIRRQSEKLGAEAGKLNKNAELFYKLYMADKSGSTRLISEAYAEAVKADPYIVLNHAAMGGSYLAAGRALSEMSYTRNLAIFALNKATVTGTEESQTKAKNLLNSKYHITP